MPYIHGTSASLGATRQKTPAKAQFAPIYVGSAPVHRATGTPGALNAPVLIETYEQFVAAFGWADDFDKYDLCEAASAHFKNTLQPIAPIVVINVFDATDTANKSGSSTSVSIPLVGRVGRIEDQDALPATFAVEGKTLGTDFTVTADETGLIFTDITEGGMTSPVSATYYKTMPANVVASTIVGTVGADGSRTGLKAVGSVYQRLGLAPSFLVCPKWGSDATVHPALLAAARDISGLFAYTCVDVPATYTTISTAVAAKASLSLIGEGEDVCWPTAMVGEKAYRMSVVRVVESLIQDVKNGGIPCDSPSNKPCFITGVKVGSTEGVIFDRDQVNSLTKEGVTTAYLSGGSWRLWGTETGACSGDGTADDPRGNTGASMRMLYYLLNSYQIENAERIDSRMTKNALQSMCVAMQEKIDRLVAAGQLYYGKAEIDSDADAVGDYANGTVSITCAATPVPLLRAAKLTLCYTDEGLTLTQN